MGLPPGAALSDSLNGGVAEAGLRDAARLKPAIEAVGLDRQPSTRLRAGFWKPCPLMKLSRAVRCGTAEGGCPCVGEGESQSQRRCFAPQGGWGHPPLHEQARDAPQFLELRNPTLRVRARVSRHRASPNRALHGQREGPGFPLPEFGKTAGAWGNPNRYSSHIPKFRRPEAAWSACSRILDHTQEG